MLDYFLFFLALATLVAGATLVAIGLEGFFIRELGLVACAEEAGLLMGEGLKSFILACLAASLEASLEALAALDPLLIFLTSLLAL